MPTKQPLIKAKIKAVEKYLPETILTNEQLANEFPSWSVDKIYEKTGIKKRHISSEKETCSYMAIQAAEQLFKSHNISPEEIDYILLCTQSPDYLLPTTACIIQNKLNIPRTAGALDFNLGCSGYIYGLSLAKGLIESHQAKKVLLITSDMYSKYINDKDKSVRTLFGDAATATLVEATNSEHDFIHSFIFGTDGSGAENLIVPHGGSKEPISELSCQEYEDSHGNIRSPKNLYMNGAEILTFTLSNVPKSINLILDKAELKKESIDRVVFHQANKFMLDKLRKKIGFTTEQFLISYETYGNTVSSSIPLGINDALNNGTLNSSHKLLICGFGVGYSWGGCIIESIG
ncbi:TPA: 3-oxoacyl-ACP synthase III family protein [Providencia alcalifaciens]